MPITFTGASTARKTATVNVLLEDVVTALKAAGFELRSTASFGIAPGPDRTMRVDVSAGESRSLFGGVARISGEAGSTGRTSIRIQLDRHTPALRPWRRDSQTRATIDVTIDNGQKMRFLEMKAVDLVATSIATRIAAQVEGITEQVATPAIG